ncbi:hypothetical protein [Arenimonas donghaensis]|uniref:Major facilitator superfamily (MFS) profile domain-containing protein n=1 Tax=Arenimonas donghaensis DSM 18148 = HO3-R19 TaxID=1121014 RepID=A0A087MFN9_9GAMM|nr:hypothetical protein [Arenimonas donghaensis]KFL35692.1 hypothetical protein N788_08115 [Arenimonas donghaensis DSM 18148 = HO3-R19]
MKALRYLIALFAGALVAGFVVAGIESLGHAVYPPPAGLDPGDMEQLKALVATLPVGALLFVVFAWAAGAYAGGLVAARIAPAHRALLAGVIGALVLAAVVANLLMIPHPPWVAVVGVLAVLVATALAAMVGRRWQRKPTGA